MIEEEISAPNDTKSVSPSPTVMLPPNTMLPSILAFPVNFKFEPVIFPVKILSPPTVKLFVTFTCEPVNADVKLPILPVTEVTFALLPVKLLIVMLEIVFPSMLPVKSIFLLPPDAKTYNASSVVE